MNDKDLIKKIKLLKATGGIDNYYELAEILGMSVKGFYNWLGGYYSLGYEKKQLLNTVIDDLFIPE